MSLLLTAAALACAMRVAENLFGIVMHAFAVRVVLPWAVSVEEKWGGYNSDLAAAAARLQRSCRRVELIPLRPLYRGSLVWLALALVLAFLA